MTDPRCKKLGASAWLCAATAGVELLLCVKFGQGMFPEPLPAWVFNTTLAAAVGLALFSAYYFGSKGTPSLLVVVGCCLRASGRGGRGGGARPISTPILKC